MNLRELIDEVDVPATRVAEGTWERARGRVRRRRWVTAGAAGLAVAAVAVAVSVLPGSEQADGPCGPHATALDRHGRHRRPTGRRWPSTGCPPPSPTPTPLSENPVGRAPW